MKKETEDAIVRIAAKIIIIMFALYGIGFAIWFKAEEIIGKIRRLFRQAKENQRKAEKRGYSEIKEEGFAE